MNLIKIERLDVNLDVLRNAKLGIQRMSATVFAIKLSLERNVIYQGIIKFLSEGADKIVDELRRLVEQFKLSYKVGGDHAHAERDHPDGVAVATGKRSRRADLH